MDNNKITVEFKERYMSQAVRRTCENMTEQQVIDMYDLHGSDIEWYRFIN